MISKQEIMALAAELQLQPHVVEKDYALGWFLAGIAAHPVIGPRWVFKGGTCLKKCYFELVWTITLQQVPEPLVDRPNAEL